MFGKIFSFIFNKCEKSLNDTCNKIERVYYFILDLNVN